MDLALKGKLALVSGSTAGIGHAIAAALAGEGARVIVNGVRKRPSTARSKSWQPWRAARCWALRVI